MQNAKTLSQMNGSIVSISVIICNLVLYLVINFVSVTVKYFCGYLIVRYMLNILIHHTSYMYDVKLHHLQMMQFTIFYLAA